jgi:hypothetical protein
MPFPALAALLPRLAPMAANLFGEGALAGMLGRGAAAAATRTAGAEAVAAATGAPAAAPAATAFGTRGIANASELFGMSRRGAIREVKPVPFPKDILSGLGNPAPSPRLPNPLLPSDGVRRERVPITPSPSAPSGGRGLLGAAEATEDSRQKRDTANDEAIEKTRKFGNAITLGADGLLGFTKSQIKVGAVMYGATKALESFAGGVVESRRGLARWNGNLASTYAKLDITKMMSEQKTANATSGSTGLLVNSFSELTREMQPIQQRLTTAVNLLGFIAAWSGKGFAIITKHIPMMALMAKALDEIEKELKKQEKVDADVMLGVLDNLKNLKPNPAEALPPMIHGPKPPLAPIK